MKTYHFNLRARKKDKHGFRERMEQPMAASFWQAVEKRAARNSLFLTKALPRAKIKSGVHSNPDLYRKS